MPLYHIQDPLNNPLNSTESIQTPRLESRGSQRSISSASMEFPGSLNRWYIGTGGRYHRITQLARTISGI